MQITNCRTATVNASTASDNTIVAIGGAGFDPGNTFQNGAAETGTQVGCVTVWQVQLEGAGANVLQFKSGASTSLGGPVTFTAAGSTATLQATGVPWFKTAAGQSLVLNLTTTAAITGTIYYTLG